jgi:hypothetical protein
MCNRKAPGSRPRFFIGARDRYLTATIFRRRSPQARAALRILFIQELGTYAAKSD